MLTEGLPPIGRELDRAATIRVGVLLPSSRVTNAIAETIAQLAGVRGCHVTPFFLIRPRTRGLGPLLRRIRREGLFPLYRAVDRLIFRVADDAEGPANLPIDVAPPARLAQTENGASPATISDAGLADLRRHDLDLIVTLAPLPDPGRVAQVARHGLWAYDHAGRPATFFWPLASGADVVATTLRNYGPDSDVPSVLYRSHSPVNRFSVHLTENPSVWKSAQFAGRCLERVRAGGWPVVGTRDEPCPAKPAYPSSLETMAVILRLLARAARRGFQKIAFKNHWFVAYRRRTPSGGPPTSLHGFTPIEAPQGRFYADPFVLQVDGSHYVAVEDYSHAARRGSISVIQLDAGGSPKAAIPVLVRPYHLSYPFLFRDVDGSVLMIPESGDHGTIEIVRAASFPHVWEREAVLMDGVHAYDPTLLYHDGRYWLFASIALRGANPWDELFLFFADTVHGPWIPHPLNPIVSDVRSARPAGRTFSLDGRLIRPAQDCSGAYGRRVVLQEIVALTTNDYRERPWSSIEPTGIRGVRRTHCYNFDGDYEVIDAFRLRPRLSIARLRRMIRE